MNLGTTNCIGCPFLGKPSREGPEYCKLGYKVRFIYGERNYESGGMGNDHAYSNNCGLIGVATIHGMKYTPKKIR